MPRKSLQLTPWEDNPGCLRALAEAQAARVAARREGEKHLVVEHRALERTTQTFGLEHPVTLRAMEKMAALLQEQEQWWPAVGMLEDVAKIRKKVLGLEHPETRRTMKQLLSILKTRRFESTADMKIVDFRTRWLDLEIEEYHVETHTHDQTLFINWKVWEHIQTELEESVAQRAASLGTQHPSTLAAMNNLGLCWARQELWEKAEELLARVRALRCKVLGPEHIDTMSTTKLLTMVYSKLGAWHEQEQLENALIRYFMRRPEDHMHVARSMQNLVLIYIMQWKMKEAEEQERALLKLRQEVLGDEHPDTIATWETLAYTMKLRHLDNEALEVMGFCAALSKRVLGEGHGQTWWRMRVVRKWTPIELQEDWRLKNVDLSQWLVDKYGHKPSLVAARRMKKRLARPGYGKERKFRRAAAFAV